MKEIMKVITALLIIFSIPVTDVLIFAEDETGFIIEEIEMESFENNGVFSIEQNETASGGSCIKDLGNGGMISHDIILKENSSEFQIYVISKGLTDKSNLSYISLDHFESYGIYAKPSDEWQITRIYYGDVPLGRHKINITSVRAGNLIDKCIIKYKIQEEVFSDNIQYLPGHEEYAELDIVDVEERQPGSYFFEMEKGTLQYPMYVEQDSLASGGAYVTSYTDKGISALTDPQMSRVVHARFRFNVTRKGTYTMFVRYYIPDKYQKSGWFGIDDSNYEKLDISVVSTDWKWMTMNVKRYLDVGWHTFDFKYRQVGLRLDCVILTNVKGFVANGFGSLPGEDIILDESTRLNIEKNNAYAKLKVNNFRYKTDTDFQFIKDQLVVPATNIVTTLGIPLEKYDGYYVAKRGRDYLKFYINSKRIVINGKVYKSPTEIFMKDNAIPMIPISLVCQAFGIDYEYQQERNTLFIFDNYTEKTRPAKDGEINIQTDYLNAYFTIPYDNPKAKVEIWAKVHLTDNEAVTIQNYDGLNAISGGGYTLSWKYYYKGMRGPSQWYTWARAYDVYYKDGAFHGSIGALERYYYDVKVRIIDGDNEEVMFLENAFQRKSPPTLSPREYAYKTDGELKLIPTFNNISYYIDYSSEHISQCAVRYRAVGEEVWREAYTPYWDEIIGQYRGSIVYLESDTEYEVCATIKGEGGEILLEKTATICTWDENPEIAETIKAKDIYQTGTLAISGIKGSPEGWIKIDGEGMTVDVGANHDYAVYIAQCEYVIFENFKIRGGTEYGVYIGGDSHDVRIINCDIAEWGVPGVLTKEFGHYLVYGNPLNYKGGIYIADIYNIVVERCYIHDARMLTNTWDGDGWSKVHPNGSSAIYQRALHGFVARYNDIIGSDEHRFNDCMEGERNGERKYSGTGSDSDIYGNMFLHSEDDIIELDGGQMNVRFYENHAEQALCGISTAPNMTGPSYIFYNLITNLGTSNNDLSGRAVKTGGSSDGINGVQYIFNNTFDNHTIAIDNCNYSGPEYHSVTRNNILVSRTGLNAMSNTTTDTRDSNDYDLMYGKVNVKVGDETHGIVGLPTYTDEANGHYTLAAESLGIDKGVYLANFSDGKTVGNAPDMGAFEYGGKLKFLPNRPVDMYANRYRVELKDGEEEEIEIYIGEIEEGLTYSLLKNIDFTWLEIISEDGLEEVAANSGSTVKFRIKTDMSHCKFEDGNGAVLFRLSNGFSIPIVVYCK